MDAAIDIFATPWWPLHVAVAWVLTRSRSFTESASHRKGKSLRSIEVMLASDVYDGKPPEMYFDCVEEAWQKLHAAMADGSVRTLGTPFKRLEVEAGAIETSEPRREIPSVEITSLESDHNDDDCLVPSDWRVVHGSGWQNLRGYREVHVFRDDVMKAFRKQEQEADATAALPCTLPQISSLKEAEGDLELAIARRLEAGQRPPSTERWPQFCDSVRDDCNGWVDKKKGSYKRRFSEKTIKRIVKEQRTDKQDKQDKQDK